MAVRLWAFFLLGFHLAACLPYGWLVRQLGGLPPFFPCLFLWSRCRSMVLGRGSAEVLPSGWFLLQFFLRVSCLRSGGGGFGWLSLAGPYVLRDVFSWCLFPSILFPSCATRGRFDVPGVLVSGSGLSASACSHACGRFRGIALGPGADLSIRLSSWWKGRLMGQRLVIVPLPGRLCLTPFLVEICRFGAISPGGVGFSSSSVCQFPVGRGGTFLEDTGRSFP